MSEYVSAVVQKSPEKDLLAIYSHLEPFEPIFVCFFLSKSRNYSAGFLIFTSNFTDHRPLFPLLSLFFKISNRKGKRPDKKCFTHSPTYPDWKYNTFYFFLKFKKEFFMYLKNLLYSVRKCGFVKSKQFISVKISN